MKLTDYVAVKKSAQEFQMLAYKVLAHEKEGRLASTAQGFRDTHKKLTSTHKKAVENVTWSWSVEKEAGVNVD